MTRYVFPLPGNGILSTSVVAGRRLASSTGMNSPVLASRPLRELSGGFLGGGFGGCFALIVSILHGKMAR